MIPDESKRHEWLGILIWSLACVFAGLFGAAFHMAACGCSPYPPAEPPYVVTDARSDVQDAGRHASNAQWCPDPSPASTCPPDKYGPGAPVPPPEQQ